MADAPPGNKILCIALIKFTVCFMSDSWKIYGDIGDESFIFSIAPEFCDRTRLCGKRAIRL